MLTRIYVDNFRCLVNFELKLDRLNLLLGENGSGKTTVFEVLRRLQSFICGELTVASVFPAEDLTRWQQLDVQRFELEVQVEKDVYVYSLAIEHDRDSDACVVKHEELRMNQSPLFEFGEGVIEVYHDDSSRLPQIPLGSFYHSNIVLLQGRSKNTLLTRFHKQIARMVVVRPVPVLMGSRSDGEEKQLAVDGSNFPSWYRYLSQEHQGNILDLTQRLREVVPGFDSFSLREAGEKTRVLKVLMHNAKKKNSLPYNFSELSDGQRQLIVLYCLLYGVRGEGYCLFLDEPENYVALREIQPWLTSLQDACGDSVNQAVLISHHPEITDYLADSASRWFHRPDNGPVRVKDMPPPTDGLTASETIARGWVE